MIYQKLIIKGTKTKAESYETWQLRIFACLKSPKTVWSKRNLVLMCDGALCVDKILFLKPLGSIILQIRPVLQAQTCIFAYPSTVDSTSNLT